MQWAEHALNICICHCRYHIIIIVIIIIIIEGISYIMPVASLLAYLDSV